jgi:hypothetical protein
LSARQVAVIKWVLAAGLYPQLAAPDRSNPFRNTTEQVFHTANGMQALLHPSSCMHAVLAEQRAPASVAASYVSDVKAGRAPAAVDMTNELLCYVKVCVCVCA